MTDPIKNFEKLVAVTRRMVTKTKQARVAVVGADEPSYLKAVMCGIREGLLDAILIGPREDIEENARSAKLDLGKITVVDRDSRVAMTSEAVKLVAENQVDFLVRGNISTGLLLARLFERPSGMRLGKNLISHVAAFEHNLYPRLLFMSDGAVNVAPDINQKLSIIRNAVSVANAIGVDMPRVAMLAAVEVIYTAMPVTMEGAVISKMQEKGQIKNCLIDGPLSMDVALIPEVAEQKGALSEVAGKADIIIAPNIETGNGIYKAMSMFAKARTAGVIVGGKVPVALSSRCDSVENIFNSLVLAAYIALKNK